MKLAKILSRSSVLNNYPRLKPMAGDIANEIEENNIESLRDFLHAPQFSKLNLEQKTLFWKAYQQAQQIYQWQQDIAEERSHTQPIPAILLNEIDQPLDLEFIDFAATLLPKDLSEHQRREALKEALQLFRLVAMTAYHNVGFVLNGQGFESLESFSLEDATDLNVLQTEISQLDIEFDWDIENLAELVSNCTSDINHFKTNRIDIQLIEDLILPQLPTALWNKKMTEFQDSPDDQLNQIEDSLSWLNSSKARREDRVLSVWPTERKGSLYATLVHSEGRVVFSNELTWDMDEPESILDTLQNVRTTYIAYPLGDADESLEQFVSEISKDQDQRIQYQLVGISTAGLEIEEIEGNQVEEQAEAAASALARRLISLLKGWSAAQDAEEYLDTTSVINYLFTNDEIDDFGDSLYAKVEELRAKAGLMGEDDELKKTNRPFRHQKIAEQIPAKTIDELKVGMELDGIVSHMKNYGVFVDIGLEQPSLVHQSELATPGMRPNRYMIGHKVRVKVLSVDVDNKRAHLSMRNVQDPNVNIPPQRGPRRMHNGPRFGNGNNDYQSGGYNRGNDFQGGNGYQQGGYYPHNNQRNNGYNREQTGNSYNPYRNNQNQDGYQNNYRNHNQDGYQNNYRSNQSQDGYQNHYRSNQNQDGYRNHYRSNQNQDGYQNHYRGNQSQDGYQSNYRNQNQDGFQSNYRGNQSQDGFQGGGMRNHQRNQGDQFYQPRDQYRNNQNQDGFRYNNNQQYSRNQNRNVNPNPNPVSDLDSMFDSKKKKD